MSGSLDGNDKKAVHKMVRILMKHGTWERTVNEHYGYLQKMRCGVVLIDRYGSDGDVKVLVDGVDVAHSFWQPWFTLGSDARRFFEKHHQACQKAFKRDQMAKARLALIAAAPDALLKATDSAHDGGE